MSLYITVEDEEVCAQGKPTIYTIDGGAATGKGTLAGHVAAARGYYHIDTGMMYRTVTHAAIEQGIEPNNDTALVKLLSENDSKTGIKFVFDKNKKFHCLYNGNILGEKFTDEIRTEEFAANVVVMAQQPVVRAFIDVAVKEFAYGKLSEKGGRTNAHNCVVEGRDAGTVVFPDTKNAASLANIVRYFVIVDEEEAGRRRAKQVLEGKEGTSTEEQAKALKVVENTQNLIKARNLADSTRLIAPLTPAKSAIMLDATNVERLPLLFSVMNNLGNQSPDKEQKDTIKYEFINYKKDQRKKEKAKAKGHTPTKA